MAYSLFDKNNKKIVFHDLQDKGPWCEHGASYEEVFIKKYGEKFKLTINPQKQQNKFAPDLLNLKTGRLGDLKTQNTPFFESQIRYSIPPQYAVVFNRKDRDRYKNQYPHIDIFFWVDWIAVRFWKYGKEIRVLPMAGVWYIPFEKLDGILEQAPLHTYQQRKNDKRGNAQSSYVINLQYAEFKKIA